MSKLDRYLLSDFAQSFLATLLVLLVVSVGGVLVDLLGRIADGQIPASLLLGQLGLQFIVYLPIILPLALMLGLLLAVGRLYRDSEMAVLNAIGVGPRRLLRPVLMLVLPVVVVVAACSLWLGPWAERTAESMLEKANRSVVMAGLEPGRFTQLSGGGVVYVSTLHDDAAQLGNVFMQRSSDDRIQVVTAERGQMFFEGERRRFLRLEDGYQTEGPAGEELNYRLIRFAANEVALPDREEVRKQDDPELLPTLSLFVDGRAEAAAQLHARITPPLLALALALLAVPLARSPPRQQRHGRMIFGFMAYLVCINTMFVGTQWLADGTIPALLGLWWLTLPALVLAVVMFMGDGRVANKKVRA